ncbi:unnamed protein product, partial [Mesorhabditis spiculigera]
MLEHACVPSLLLRPHIHRGYRPLHEPHIYYWSSIFGVHNELINVWTHLVPFIIIVCGYLLPEWRCTEPSSTLILLYIGVAALLGCSTLAHLMHSRSHVDHFFWWTVDFSGIAIWMVVTGMVAWMVADDKGRLFDVMYPLILVLLAGIQFFSTAYLFIAYPEWPARHLIRMLTCTSVAIWVNAPIAYGLLRALFTWEFTTSQLLHWRSIAWLAASGVFMGGNVPERWFPGRFDLLGYGHQFFHLCINMVNWNLIEATKQRVEAMKWVMVVWLVIVVVVNIYLLKLTHALHAHRDKREKE